MKKLALYFILFFLLSSCSPARDELFLALTIHDINVIKDCGIVSIQTKENAIPETRYSSTYIGDLQMLTLVMDISPDGKLLAVTTQGPNDDLDIILLNPRDPSSLPTVIDSTLGYQFQPSFSPDGRTLAYSYISTDRAMSEIRLFDVGNSQSRTLTNTPGAIMLSPDAWSPDGNRLAYTIIDSLGTTKLYVLNLKSKESRLIAEVPSDDNYNISPYVYSWSKDNKIISLNAGDGAYLVNVDGSGFEKLQRCGNECEVFEWSPDGNGLIGVNHDNAQLSIFYPDQTEKVLFQTNGRIQAPVWSPDGQDVAFFLVENDDNGLSVLGLETKNLTQTVYFSINGEYDFDLSFLPKMVWYSDRRSNNNLEIGGISTFWFWLCGIGLILLVAVGFLLLILGKRRTKVKVIDHGSPQQQTQEKQSEPKHEMNLTQIEHQTPTVTIHDQGSPQGPYISSRDLNREIEESIKYLRNKDFDSAIRGLATVIKADPRNIQAWLWLGSALAQSGHTGKARECVLRAKALGAPNTDRALKWIDSLEKDEQRST